MKGRRKAFRGIVMRRAPGPQGDLRCEYCGVQLGEERAEMGSIEGGRVFDLCLPCMRRLLGELQRVYAGKGGVL